MSEREIIIPPAMHGLVDREGDAPAVRIGKTLFCAGQVGRTAALEVITDNGLASAVEA